MAKKKKRSIREILIDAFDIRRESKKDEEKLERLKKELERKKNKNKEERRKHNGS